jgi:hypothetical protein
MINRKQNINQNRKHTDSTKIPPSKNAGGNNKTKERKEENVTCREIWRG